MNSKEEILAKIKQSVVKTDKDAYVILFGSQARNQATEHSDWDILIITSKKISRTSEQAFRRNLIDVELEYGIPISSFIRYEKDWFDKYRFTPFFDSIKNEGIKL